MSRPTGSGGPARPPRPSGFLIGAGLVVLLVLACRIAIPFEDAFITLRCARNLAEHGEYTYNLGERNFAGSSHLYTLLAASAYLPGRAPAMWLISLGNSMASVLAAYCLARTSHRIECLKEGKCLYWLRFGGLLSGGMYPCNMSLSD